MVIEIFVLRFIRNLASIKFMFKHHEMKKHLLLIALLISCLSLNAQSFFSEDFASGIPAGWTNVDNSGNNVLWRTTTTGALSMGAPVDAQLNPVGTSAANGYLILDSDSAGSSLTENTELTTVAINCSGHPNVYLTFNEYFAQYGNSQGIVKVSNDNIFWVDVHHAETGLVSDSGTANPNLVVIDISATAANQSTVYIRFNYIGAYDYWWFVDDIQLYEPSATDLAVTSIEELNTDYTQIPLSQSTALTLSAEVINAGLNVAANGSALLELIDAVTTLPVFSETINLSSLNPGASQIVVPSSGFAAPAPGIYYARVTVIIPGDGNASNDVLTSGNVFISDSVYSRDNDAISGALQIGSGAGEDGIAGQNFMVNSSADLTSITVFLKDTFSFSASGTPLFLTVHPQLNDTTGPDGTTVLAVTDTLLLFPGMIPAGGAFYTLAIHGGFVHLIPGLYFIGFHEDADMIPMGVGTDIYTAGAVWVHFNSIPTPPAVNGWAHAEDFGYQLAYMIRANFGMLPDAVQEVSKTSRPLIFPNPSSGIINIRFEKQEENYQVTIYNSVGQRVYNTMFHGIQQHMIDLSHFPVGLYSVQILCNGYSSSQKICVSGK